jgi:hypothetical protein
MSVKSFKQVDVAVKSSEVAQYTSNASNLAELITTLPRAYQAALGDQLTKKYRLAHKHANVQSTISLYERHLNEGSFPPIIRNSLKDPKLQFAKEFLSTTNGSNAPSTFAAAVLAARTAVLKSAIEQKKQEKNQLAELILPDEHAWIAAVKNVGTLTAASVGGAFGMSSDGLPTMTGVPQAAAQECLSVFRSCEMYTYRVLALARASIDRTDIQKLAKIKLKDTTDVEMTDVSKEPAVRDIIREEIKSLKLELSRANGWSPPVKRRCDELTLSHRETKKTRQSSTEAQRLWEESEGWRKERQITQGKEVTLDTYLHECSKEFRPWAPDTFPNVYLGLSDRTRIKIGLAFLREWEADSLRASRPGVFQFPDVHLPEDIAYMLAVNHKYVLHPKPQDHDVASAKDQFVRSVRIRWLFRNDTSNQEFIPKFHVSNPFWTPPPASQAIELGLDNALAVIDSQVGQALATLASQPPRQRNLNWTRVQQYLESHDLLVKLTDKNLGLAVFQKEWYVREIEKMLADEDTYLKVHTVNVEYLLGHLMKELPKWRLPHAMERFIREKTTSKIPEFHAIPKVHKKPWALRPIVPSHSWVTSRLSEVVDHLCRPILAHMTWVVDSTKSVVATLDKVRIEPGKNVWICTGDVVAFYTNINASQCAKTVAKAWEFFQPESKINARTISQMIRFVMDNNLFSFQEDIWKQLNGLAMGTSCAPVLANIYAAFFERRCHATTSSGVLMYVRYIDDILCIFQGTKNELMDYLASIRLGPLTINWSYSATKKEFLDLEIMRIQGPTGPRLGSRLFKKTMNRHLYIPWSSAHPLHVKKAFVKAELIRFAIVSSEVGYFAEARSQFYGNLRRRGYPPQALENWFEQVSYDDRPLFLAPKVARDEVVPLMLSGQYNPVWEYINVGEIIGSARQSWSQEMNLPESLQQPLIRSLRRYTSLFDLLSTWNKTILHPSMLSSERTTDRQAFPTPPRGGVSGGLPGANPLPEGSGVVVRRFPGLRSLELVDRSGALSGSGQEE